MKKREAGVGIIIKVDKNIEINDPNFTDPRTMGIDIKINGFNNGSMGLDNMILTICTLF